MCGKEKTTNRKKASIQTQTSTRNRREGQQKKITRRHKVVCKIAGRNKAWQGTGKQSRPQWHRAYGGEYTAAGTQAGVVG